MLFKISFLCFLALFVSKCYASCSDSQHGSDDTDKKDDLKENILGELKFAIETKDFEKAISLRYDINQFWQVLNSVDYETWNLFIKNLSERKNVAVLCDESLNVDEKLLRNALLKLASVLGESMVEYFCALRPLKISSKRRSLYHRLPTNNPSLSNIFNLIGQEGRIDILTTDEYAIKTLSGFYRNALKKIHSSEPLKLTEQEKFCIRRALFLIDSSNYFDLLSNATPCLKAFMIENIPHIALYDDRIHKLLPEKFVAENGEEITFEMVIRDTRKLTENILSSKVDLKISTSKPNASPVALVYAINKCNCVKSSDLLEALNPKVYEIILNLLYPDIPPPSDDERVFVFEYEDSPTSVILGGFIENVRKAQEKHCSVMIENYLSKDLVLIVLAYLKDEQDAGTQDQVKQ